MLLPPDISSFFAPSHLSRPPTSRFSRFQRFEIGVPERARVSDSANGLNGSWQAEFSCLLSEGSISRPYRSEYPEWVESRRSLAGYYG